MTFPKTSLALLALFTLAACEKNKHDMIHKEVTKTSVGQKPNLLTEATQIKPIWERSQSVSAGAKGKLTIVPFDESQLYSNERIQRRMLVLNDDKDDPMFIEVYSVKKIPDDNLNRVIANFISYDKAMAERMIQEFEGTIIVYDRSKMKLGGWTYNKKYNKPAPATLSLDSDGSRMAPPAEECWWVVLTTTYIQYFPDGTYYTWSESEIIGQYCTTTNTSGGGGSNTCNNNLSNLLQGTATSDGVPAIFAVDEGPTTRSKLYTWKIYRQDQGIYYFESTEKGYHKKINNVWKWDRLEHISITRSGAVVGGSLECLLISATSTIGEYHAGMELKYKIKADVICQNSPISAITPMLTSGIFINVNA